MGKKDRGLKKAALQVNPVVVEFIEAAAVGDVRAVKKIAKSGTIEIDDGEREREGVVGAGGGGVSASPLSLSRRRRDRLPALRGAGGQTDHIPLGTNGNFGGREIHTM